MDIDRSLPVPAPDDPLPEIAALARRWRRAQGPLIAVLNRLGGSVERQLARLPESLRRVVDAVVRDLLSRGMGLAAFGGKRMPRSARRAAPVAAALAGAAGGAGGLATAAAELPVTLTLILGAIAAEAEAEGFDTDDPRVRAECLRVLATGAPGPGDDAVETAFIGARLALSGAAVQKMLATFAPPIAAVLTRKLAAQAVPVLGAASGAALNAAYLGYYRELAAIRFRLLRLGETHGPERVAAAFAQAVAPPRVRA